MVPFLCRKICSRLLTWPLVVCRHALTPLGLHTHHTDFCLHCHRYSPRMQDSVSISPLCIMTPITVDYGTDAFVTNYLLVALRPGKVMFRSAWRLGHRSVGRGPGPAHVPTWGLPACRPLHLLPSCSSKAQPQPEAAPRKAPQALPYLHNAPEQRFSSRRALEPELLEGLGKTRPLGLTMTFGLVRLRWPDGLSVCPGIS